VIAIPVSALTTVGQVRGVFIERHPAYTFVPVDTGREGGGWVEVRHGLKAGDQVVIEGVFDLKNVLLKEHIGTGE
jgi:multidrug efflux pump subunit AcrA (membrane-fusion protein)